MRWLFMWQDENLNMAYEVFSCGSRSEAREQFDLKHPDVHAFAVISGDFDVEEFHA